MNNNQPSNNITLSRQIDLSELGFNYTEFKVKQGNFISNHEFYMSMACLAALSSPDPSTKVGACIANQDKRIVGIGFNDFPMKFYENNFKKDFSFENFKKKYENSEEAKYICTKYPYICHAAENAILNKNSSNLKNCTLFTNILPCNECLKLIIQSGIKKVYYLTKKESENKSIDENWKESTKGSEVMSIICGVELIKYDKKLEDIKFESRGIKITFDQDSFDEQNKMEKEDFKYPNFMKNFFTSSENESVKELKEKDFFMFVAQLTSFRSKDPNKQVGACIVDKNGKIVSTGYNGFPNNPDDKFPWEQQKIKNVNCKNMYVCHAELNAIVNKYDADISGCTIYQTLFPCVNCARLIIQSQIKEIFYYEFDEDKKKKPEFIASKELLEMYGISCKPFKPEVPVAEISKLTKIR